MNRDIWEIVAGVGGALILGMSTLLYALGSKIFGKQEQLLETIQDKMEADRKANETARGEDREAAASQQKQTNDAMSELSKSLSAVAQAQRESTFAIRETNNSIGILAARQSEQHKEQELGRRRHHKQKNRLNEIAMYLQVNNQAKFSMAFFHDDEDEMGTK